MFELFHKVNDSIFYRLTHNRQTDTFISAIDLMQPINGIVNAAQLTVVSRMLDIERVKSGEESYWDVRINECRKEVSDEERAAMHKQTESLVASMDRYGWDHNISRVIVNRVPFYMYNGTHRTAYSLLQNPFQLIPITIDGNGWEWSKQNGIIHFGELGLRADEIAILSERYNRLLSDYSYPLQVVFRTKDFFEHESDVKAELGKIAEVGTTKSISHIPSTLPTWMSKRDQVFLHNSKGGIVILIFKPLKYNINFKNSEFRSYNIEEAICNAGIKHFMYTATITKSIEMDLWLKDNSRMSNGNK